MDIYCCTDHVDQYGSFNSIQSDSFFWSMDTSPVNHFGSIDLSSITRIGIPVGMDIMEETSKTFMEKNITNDKRIGKLKFQPYSDSFNAKMNLK